MDEQRRAAHTTLTAQEECDAGLGTTEWEWVKKLSILSRHEMARTHFARRAAASEDFRSLLLAATDTRYKSLLAQGLRVIAAWPEVREHLIQDDPILEALQWLDDRPKQIIIRENMLKRMAQVKRKRGRRGRGR